jgi:hypothetical protein
MGSGKLTYHCQARSHVRSLERLGCTITIERVDGDPRQES